MCRILAYAGRPILLEDLVCRPKHSLVHQALDAHESRTTTNGDGFGIGWYGERPEPGLYRETLPAWSDENLRSICSQVRSRLFFAHVRAFLDEQRSVLEGLDDATLSGALDALQATLSPAKSNLARAEQLWQLYLAGLPELHPLQVQQALQALSLSDLLRAHEQLLLARDWRVLASGAPAPV